MEPKLWLSLQTIVTFPQQRQRNQVRILFPSKSDNFQLQCCTQPWCAVASLHQEDLKLPRTLWSEVRSQSPFLEVLQLSLTVSVPFDLSTRTMCDGFSSWLDLTSLPLSNIGQLIVKVTLQYRTRILLGFQHSKLTRCFPEALFALDFVQFFLTGFSQLVVFRANEWFSPHYF